MRQTVVVAVVLVAAAAAQAAIVGEFVMVAQPEAAKQLQDQLSYWLGDTPIQIFPEADALPYERLAPDPSTIQQRIKTLSILKGVDSQDVARIRSASRSAPQIRADWSGHRIRRVPDPGAEYSRGKGGCSY